MNKYTFIFYNRFACQTQLFEVEAKHKLSARHLFWKKYPRKSYHNCIEDILEDQKKKTFVVLTQDEDGFIVAECPQIPGCVSQGKTREEAIENIKEAFELCREVRQELNMPELEVVEL